MDQKEQPKPILEERREKPRLTSGQREDLHNEALDKLYRQRYKDILAGRLSEDDYVRLTRTETKRWEDLAGTDAMTGLLNRRMCEERAESIVTLEKEHGHPVAIMELDIDHFKIINDEHGHPVGDEVLRAIGGALQRIVGKDKEKVAGRWGGEEFLIVLPHAEGEELTKMVREIRNEAVEVMSGVLGRPVTVSIGIIEVGENEKFTEAMRNVDAALYKAKRSVKMEKNEIFGRNRAMIIRKGATLEQAEMVAFE